ncbi:hypothetical protein ZQ65_25330 [Salmonella enterica subsp. enterica serovar Newport]|uniref:Uncharacterized protein n=1 Tax=Salmonella newport TaxID=108619 RepID=A0A5U9KXT7_SALNE|nr:hypothetical protein [Salmonella enterica]EBS2695953.1 hypothetical protein [Salmonella enterica subsp. enterica serovar Newport]EBE9837650.1 hypothetical protein [Salmonella enterica]ECI0980459.1 hypothetical protein [Salmonella enterica subsp. enterica serovar Newport]ECN8543006.1 hypothetical protein [Salmonella enterica subsp. enterica serovar Newport]
MNKENLSWWLSFLFSGLVSYCLWLWMSPGWDPEYLFPGTLFAAMLSFTAVFGATLHMQQYSDRFIAPVFLVLSVLFSLLFVVYVWGLAMVFYSQG